MLLENDAVSALPQADKHMQLIIIMGRKSNVVSQIPWLLSVLTKRRQQFGSKVNKTINENQKFFKSENSFVKCTINLEKGSE